jgi:hypothetical protein
MKQAHDIITKVLRGAGRQNIRWTTLPVEKVPGGTAPESVRAAIADLEARLNKKVSKTGAKP